MTRFDSVHLVDGGYFENSGIATARDLAAHIRLSDQRAQMDTATIKYVPSPYYIVIRFEDHSGRPVEWAADPLAPVRTILNARAAHATLALNELRGETADAALVKPTELLSQRNPLRFEFTLHGERCPLPLGWLLSERARRSIERQAGTGPSSVDEQCEESGSEASNRIVRERLDAVLKASRP